MEGKFLPSFEIRSLKSSPSALQKFKDENPDIDILETRKTNDEDTFPIDLDKLSYYIEFQLNIRRRVKGKSSYKIANFRRCTVEDFEKHHFAIGDFERPIYLSRFCPDIQGLEEDYRVMNSYTNYLDRNSFAVEIIKCNK